MDRATLRSMLQRRKSRVLATLSILWFSSCAWGAMDASQVLILVNRDVPMSGQVAQMYQRLRGIPAENVLRLAMGPDRRIASEKYWSAITPVRKYLDEHANIRCILTTAGVP